MHTHHKFRIECALQISNQIGNPNFKSNGHHKFESNAQPNFRIECALQSSNQIGNPNFESNGHHRF